MPNTAPPTMAELKQCRKTILRYIREARKVADFAEKEMVTLQAALDHIELLIKDFDPDKGSKKSSASPSKKSAA